MNNDPKHLQALAPDCTDPDWSQVRETVMMLNLAVAQISGAMRDGDESVATLTDTFAAMMTNIDAIQAASDALPAESSQKDEITRNCAAISSQMQTTIVAFQFYDKLSQRLDHLAGTLASLGALVGRPEQLCNPSAWRALQADIKSRYTVESDKALFDAILSGVSIEEALRQNGARDDKPRQDDIELF